jgi:cytochrome c biogenesis protein CcdA
MENDLPQLVEKYGEQLEIASVAAAGPAEYQVYLAAVDLFEVPPQRQGVPAVYIGGTHLVGTLEIRNDLDRVIEEHLEHGGVDYPPIPGLQRLLDQTAGEKEPEEVASTAEPIYLAYFYQTGCQDCDRVQADLALSEWLGERAGVPQLRRLTAPTVFVGDDYVLEEELDARSLEALIIEYTPDGAERFWEGWEESAGSAVRRGIVERFESLGAFTVVFAGLVDGLNPCAFATLIFFVSYLTISGRKGREILLVGAAFTSGVFLAYMGVGLGFYHVLDLLGDLLAQLGRWVYGLTGAFCIVLAAFSFLDYLKARRGNVADMSLNLPHKLRLKINAVIRRTRTSRAFVGAAFGAGVVVSFLELACTGQVYLPTIIFVMSMPDLKARATLFLVIYNLLFTAPLVVVFVLAYYGTGAKQFSDFLQRRASTVKLGLSFLFLALGGWLLISLV